MFIPRHARAMARRLSLLALLLVAAPAAGQVAPRAIAARARPAVVRVTALAGGQEISQGTGFFVASDGSLVTNRHVVEGAEQLRVELASGEIFDHVFMVSSDARRDLVILRIPATGTPHLDIADDHALQVGDPVFVMGNPMGLDGTFSDGLLSAKRTLDGVVLLQISAPISPGSSGGPVFDADGDVIGVATLTLRDAQNLNIAIPARYAQGLLAMHDEPQPFEDVAGEFAESESSEDRPGTAASASTDDDDLPEWAQVLADEIATVQELASESGYEKTHDLVVDMLDQGAVDSVAYTFDQKGTFMIVGVCDADCTDLDLGIYDANGNAIATDVETDDRPVLSIDVIKPGTFQVRVDMVQCSVEPCGFGLQAYQKK